MVDALPTDLIKGLQGIYLTPETKHNEKIPSDNYYVMGCFIKDPYLGHRIELYYGSIMALHANLDMSSLCNELHKILTHELRHHVETKAGCADLVKDDDEYVQNALNNLRKESASQDV